MTTVDEEREALLPRTARDQRELAAAVEELRVTSIQAGRHAALWFAAGLLVLVALRLAVRRLS